MRYCSAELRHRYPVRRNEKLLRLLQNSCLTVTFNFQFEKKN